MAIEHNEFFFKKSFENWPKERIKELKQSIIDQAKTSGIFTVEVNYGNSLPVGFVKVERKLINDGGEFTVTDEQAFETWRGEHTQHVTDISFDALADLDAGDYWELIDFVAARWPWAIVDDVRYPTFIDCIHKDGTVILAETGEVVPGVKWEAGEPVYSYTVKAVEANKSGNPGTKSPKLESVAKAIGGGFAQLTSGEMFAIEGEVVE